MRKKPRRRAGKAGIAAINLAGISAPFVDFSCFGPKADASISALDVRSQQVVHPAWTEEAEVAEALAILEGPDEHS
jgi:hypothetical protein